MLIVCYSQKIPTELELQIISILNISKYISQLFQEMRILIYIQIVLIKRIFHRRLIIDMLIEKKFSKKLGIFRNIIISK